MVAPSGAQVARGPGVVWSAVLLSCFMSTFFCAARATDQGTPADELEIFKIWLEREHKGYGCDEGPARFHNDTLEAAYAGRRFYYILTYTRGVRPPFENSLSLVVQVDDDGNVSPLDPSSPATYRPGLRKVSTVK